MTLNIPSALMLHLLLLADIPYEQLAMMLGIEILSETIVSGS
jgi:hypothetical protein